MRNSKNQGKQKEAGGVSGVKQEDATEIGRKEMDVRKAGWISGNLEIAEARKVKKRGKVKRE